MKKITSLFTGAMLLGAIALTPMIALAQTNSMAMPVLYDQNGTVVNSSTVTPLAAGWYYLGTGAPQNIRVYYYGNGTYYDPNTGLYGGSVSNPMGTAGVLIASTGGVSVPTVPNTGAGGGAIATWVTLVVAALIAIGGISYMVYQRNMIA